MTGFAPSRGARHGYYLQDSIDAILASPGATIQVICPLFRKSSARCALPAKRDQMGEIASGYPERSECGARQANGITIPGHRAVQYSPGEDEAVILPRVPPSFLSPGWKQSRTE